MIVKPLIITDKEQLQQYLNKTAYVQLSHQGLTKEGKPLEKKYLEDIWEEFYEQYLFILTRCKHVGFFEAKNISRKLMKDTTINEKDVTATPYVLKNEPKTEKEINNYWEDFKNSLLKKGSFFAFIVKEEYNEIVLQEGFHRHKAILELIEEKKLPEDFKILCISTKEEYYLLVTNIASQLGCVENKLRLQYNIEKYPKKEIIEQGFFGYLNTINIGVKSPTMSRIFKSLDFKNE